MSSQAESPTTCLDQHMSFQRLGLVTITNVYAATAEVTDFVCVSDW